MQVRWWRCLDSRLSLGQMGVVRTSEGAWLSLSVVLQYKAYKKLKIELTYALNDK